MITKLIILLIIVVTCCLIINNLIWIWDYQTSRNVQKATFWAKFPKRYENLMVKEITCSKSKCTFWPTIQNIISHYDVICLCDDGNYYNITYWNATDKYKKHYAKKHNEYSILDFKAIYEVRKVKPVEMINHRKTFKLNRYKYICKKFKKLNEPVELKFVYQLVHNITGVEWGIISHNCHYHAKDVCELILGQKKLKDYIQKFNPKHFERYVSDFKPLILFKEVLKENLHRASRSGYIININSEHNQSEDDQAE